MDFQIFKDYTKKQWDKYPSEIDAAVLARLPFRLDNDDRYFADPFQVTKASFTLVAGCSNCRRGLGCK